MTILDQIRGNDITDLHLHDVPESYFEESKELIDALKENKSLESVRMDKDFIACLFGEDRDDLLGQLGKLPNLKEVNLGDVGVMVQVLTNLVTDAKGLRELTLECVVMQGIQDHFDILETVFHQHTGLKDFQMNDCVSAIEGIDMEKIMKAGKSFNPTIISDPTQVKQGAIAA
jgi:hypothetical protein